MPRSIDSTLAAAMAAPNYQPVILGSFAFRSQTEYAWSGVGTLVWNGLPFAGVGSLGRLGAIGNGSAQVVEAGTSAELSGLDSIWLGESLGDVQMGAPVSIWIGAWQNGALLGTPYLLWSGGMGAPHASPDPHKFTITLALQTKLAQLGRPTCRRYTAADQRLYYPDDSGFNWVEVLNDAAFRWGG